jgi:hypothetical protein
MGLCQHAAPTSPPSRGNPGWRSSGPLALRDPNGFLLNALSHQRVKRVARRNRHCDAESRRNLLFDLHQAEHVRNFRSRVVINEEIEIAVGPLRPTAREPKMNSPVRGRRERELRGEVVNDKGRYHSRDSRENNPRHSIREGRNRMNCRPGSFAVAYPGLTLSRPRRFRFRPFARIEYVDRLVWILSLKERGGRVARKEANLPD